MQERDLDQLLGQVYDAETFRRQGHAVVDRLADHLAQTMDRQGPVLPWAEPAAASHNWAQRLDRVLDGGGTLALDDLLTDVLRQVHHLHHPGYMGHQVTPPLPAAALLDLVAALLNNSAAIYEMSPVATAMERAVVQQMSHALRLGPAADGVLTSGGSAGNLTALLAARQARAGFDVWDQGSNAGPALGLLMSEQAHYSATRAAQVMGLGRAGCVPVATDERFRLDPAALPGALRKARHRGLQVLAVVASAGSTATGAFDPLEAVADFCEQHGLWLHVDGAHGAAACLSPRYQHLVAGIERADSVVWDAHKMLAMPSLVTAALFRDGGCSYDAFAQEASYLLGPSSRDEWYNLCHRTLECTKNAMALKLYGTLALLGPQVLQAYVTRCFDLGQRLARQIEQAPDFELALWPQGNIVCFRHVPRGVAPGRLDALQDTVRQRVVQGGSHYLVQTELRGRRYLRCTLMNPRTTEDDLSGLLQQLRAAQGQS